MKTSFATLVVVLASAVTLVPNPPASAAPPKSKTGADTAKPSLEEGNLDIQISTATLSRIRETIRDGSGRIARTSDVSPTGTVTTRDSSGRIVSTSSEDPHTGTVTHRDGKGRITGNTQKMASGTEVTRDSKGRIAVTSSSTKAGDSETTTYRDGSGRILGTKYVSPAGNVTYRDSNGRITGPNFK